MRKAFEVGQRVRAYGPGLNRNTNDYECDGESPWRGTVDSYTGGFLNVRAEFSEKILVLHLQQCRRLIKKPRRRVWIKFHPEHASIAIDTITSQPTVDGWTEYQEVRKPK